MKIKKLTTLLLVSVMILGCLTACGKSEKVIDSKLNDNSNGEKLKIIVTIFPEYDWVREIMGEKFEDANVEMLLDNGVDLHSYQPSAEDILKITESDLFIYVGGESDSWVEDVMKDASNKDLKMINLLDTLGSEVKEEEIVEGMEAEEEEEEESGEGEEEVEYDEHVWLSLKNAKVLCSAIAESLKEIDNANAAVYDTNLNSYIEKLDELDAQYKNTVDSAENDTILFGDRFPFRYLVDDYGINYYAAFVGCSAESEASFETIMFLANKVDELKLPAICTIEGTEHKIAETIKETTKNKDQEILEINSLQSVSSTMVDDGTTYLSVMADNLEVLNKALTFSR